MKKLSLFLFLLAGMLLVGCKSEQSPPQPPANTPTPAPIDPVAPPTPKPVDPPPANTPTPVPPQPAVNIDEQIKKLSTPDRQAAAVTLAGEGKSAVPALMIVLGHNDWQVRAAAVFALGQIGPDAAAAKPRLKTMAAQDEHASVRDAAAFALDAMQEAR